MTNHYELLGVSRQATNEEIKRAFRHEISRYHPDKVQHLGREFQELAAIRAADLTQAYRILMDATSRAAYDDELKHGGPAAAAPGARAAPARGADPVPPPPPDAERVAPPPRDRTGDQFVRRAALQRFRDAVGRALDPPDAVPVRGFDVTATHTPKRVLFRKADPDLRVLARFVPFVDAAAIDETWPLAVRAVPASPAKACVFLMGVGMAGKSELAKAIDHHRRQSRGRGDRVLLVPLDVRDWEALIPTGTPPPVRAIIDRLRNRT